MHALGAHPREIRWRTWHEVAQTARVLRALPVRPISWDDAPGLVLSVGRKIRWVWRRSPQELRVVGAATPSRCQCTAELSWVPSRRTFRAQLGLIRPAPRPRCVASRSGRWRRSNGFWRFRPAAASCCSPPRCRARLGQLALGASLRALWHTPVGVRFGSLGLRARPALLDQRRADGDLLLRRRARDPPRDPRGRARELRRAALPLAAALGGMLAARRCIYVGAQRGRARRARAGASRWRPTSRSRSACSTLLGSARRRRRCACCCSRSRSSTTRRHRGHRGLLLRGARSVRLRGRGRRRRGRIVRLQRLGVRLRRGVRAAGVVVWGGVYAAGVHPTLAGVVARPDDAGARLVRDRGFPSSEASDERRGSRARRAARMRTR